MTATRVKDGVVSLTLTNSNVKQAVKSYTMSKRYINVMLRASVINILYHRLNIDEKEYITKAFNNVTYKSFKSKSKNPFIREYHSYMTACKDALEKNYLKEFYLFFIDVASGDILENYKFSLKYHTDKDSRTQVQSEDLTENTCDLLKTLQDLERLEKLNTEIQVKVEFSYFDDTPDEYEPPGFRNISQSEALIEKLGTEGNSIVIGTLFTGFHKLRCRGRGQVFNTNTTNKPTPDDDNNDFQLNLTEDENKELNTDSSVIVAVDGGLLTEDLSEPEFNKSNSTNKKRFDDTYISHVSEYIDISSDNEDAPVNCQCGIPALDDCSLDKVECSICKVMYHAPCQGYLDKSFIGGTFSCINCRDEVDSIVDPKDVRKTKTVYKVRFFVAVIYKYGKIPESLNKPLFNQIRRNIETHNVFTIEGNELVIQNMNVLKTLFKFHHKKPDLRKQI
ncbi:hypothetical protein TcasGA2_TC000115 [Tribolium castaneum]|uniref:HORMA domain-containing protein n=1 Tax=Tribolium castaneum TaxID=7070 RepID=D6WDA0_TRICA|nr:PREDICTED: HORMA domain-containing protein 1 [Tribolium castaneum]EEZ99533.1 hypothetical protein TcasGA2_TC000115 [Tribolium castaneum]|eukprot:XP_008199539.2 PREDICTED: HORMA domain-containing protein 1 [Tribolium castaneum]